MKLSIVVPARDEASRITRTLEGVLGYLKHRGSFEVVVVDDGSRDLTATLVEAYAQRHPEVRLVRLPRPMGKGAAVRRGILEAQGQIILFSDADLSAPIAEMEKLLVSIESGYDVAIASRALAESQILTPQPWTRRAVGWAFRWMTRALFHLPFADTQCGFKGFQRRAAREIFSRSCIHGFTFDVEMLLLAQRLGFSVAEVPIRWADNPESSVRLSKHLVQICSELGAIFIRLRLGSGWSAAAHPRGKCRDADGGGDSHQRLDAPSVPAFHVKETLRQGNR